MYQDFYGLRELPFELTPNPKYLYLAPSHREALSNLEYGLSTAKAITVVIGDAGTGKTTLLQTAVRSPDCAHVKCVRVNNPTLTREEFVESLAAAFELTPRAGQSKATFLRELESALRKRRAHGEITALVIDEAQSLSGELLEEIRLLANIETTTHKLLPVVLAGQPEIGSRLDQPELRQLKQRIALRCQIDPFEIDETAAYIVNRFRVAGGDATRVFTRPAVSLIHEYSGGIPRTINVICDNALVHGLALGREKINQDVVAEVSRDFALRASSGVESVPPKIPGLQGAMIAETKGNGHTPRLPHSLRRLYDAAVDGSRAVGRSGRRFARIRSARS